MQKFQNSSNTKKPNEPKSENPLKVDVETAENSPTPNQIKELYNIVCYILKCLDCEDEKVTLAGINGKRLRNLCDHANVKWKIPLFSHSKQEKSRNMSSVKDSYNVLSKLEQSICEIETKLECHLTTCSEQQLLGEFEAIHTIPDCRQGKVLKALKAPFFFDILEKTFLKLLLQDMGRTADKLHLVELELAKWQMHLKKTETRSLDKLLADVALKYLQVDVHHQKFEHTLTEIQVISEDKVLKEVVSELKKEILKDFERLDEAVEALNEGRQLSVAAAFFATAGTARKAKARRLVVYEYVNYNRPCILNYLQGPMQQEFSLLQRIQSHFIERPETNSKLRITGERVTSSWKLTPQKEASDSNESN